MKRRGKKAISLFEIYILVFSVIAFSIIISGNSELVSAAGRTFVKVRTDEYGSIKKFITADGIAIHPSGVTKEDKYTGGDSTTSSFFDRIVIINDRQRSTKLGVTNAPAGGLGVRDLGYWDEEKKEFVKTPPSNGKGTAEAPAEGKAEAAGKAALPGFLGQMGLKESWGGHLLAGVIYAAAAYGALEFFVNMIGLKDEQKKSVQYGVSSIVGTYQLIKSIQSTEWGKASKIFSEKGLIGGHAGLISVGIGVAVFPTTSFNQPFP